MLTSHGKWITGADNGTAPCSATVLNVWERWTVEYAHGRPDTIHLRSYHGKYLCAEADGRVVANRPAPGPWETFQVVTTSPTTFALRVRAALHWLLCLQSCRAQEVLVVCEACGDLYAVVHDHNQLAVLPQTAHGKFVSARPDGALSSEGHAKGWEQLSFVRNAPWGAVTPQVRPRRLI